MEEKAFTVRLEMQFILDDSKNGKAFQHLLRTYICYLFGNPGGRFYYTCFTTGKLKLREAI